MQTTDGNLSVHARKLEEASYIACTKSFEGRVPEDGVHDHRRGTPCARAVPRPHGSSHSGDARALTSAVTQSSFDAYEAIDRQSRRPLNGIHVGIIMDGNGRWAAARGLPRTAGHRAGVRTARKIVEAATRSPASARSRCTHSRPTTGAARLPRSAR